MVSPKFYRFHRTAFPADAGRAVFLGSSRPYQGHGASDLLVSVRARASSSSPADIGAGRRRSSRTCCSSSIAENMSPPRSPNTQLGAPTTCCAWSPPPSPSPRRASTKATLLRRFEAFVLRVHQEGQRALLLRRRVPEPVDSRARGIADAVEPADRRPRAAAEASCLASRNSATRWRAPELDQLRQRVIRLLSSRAAQ